MKCTWRNIISWLQEHSLMFHMAHSWAPVFTRDHFKSGAQDLIAECHRIYCSSSFNTPSKKILSFQSSLVIYKIPFSMVLLHLNAHLMSHGIYLALPFARHRQAFSITCQNSPPNRLFSGTNCRQRHLKGQDVSVCGFPESRIIFQCWNCLAFFYPYFENSSYRHPSGMRQFSKM